jgi:transcriptional regulator with XRE-family HTH domain
MSNIGNKETMSKNLKYYIERSGKDRKTLAKIWGFPYSTVTDWINGNKYPRIDRIEVMAEYFGIQKSDLIEDKEEKPTTQKDDGLSKSQKALMQFARSVPDDKAEKVLRLMQAILEAD